MASVTAIDSPVAFGQRFQLSGVNWEEYIRITDALSERPIRSTYDGSTLELMSPLPIHERLKKLMARLIEAATFELGIPICSGGSFTFRSAAVERGLEPDECYWIQNEPLVRGRTELQFPPDPPPDLAIEIDISRSSLNRRDVYRRLGVPELWVFDGEQLETLILGDSGRYESRDQSVALPPIDPQLLTRWILPSDQDEHTQVRGFLEALRKSK